MRSIISMVDIEGIIKERVRREEYKYYINSLLNIV